MGQVMTLLDAVRSVRAFDRQSTIYAAVPWTLDSRAVVGCETESGGVPPEAESFGLTYFVEVSVACEFLESWENGRHSKPTDEEKCERMIQYAVNDA